MGKFGKFMDRVITIWTIVFNMVVGFILSAFAIAAMFNDMYWSDTWNSLLLSVVSIVMVNIINFAIKVLLRSFKK